ncbi:hypothetical protein [Streptosporangium longisporum]|uniref:Uncharacterized protein n=1 Tax=Streptosporangium longisporum TaxID=46187 RepID=A0ABP6KXQ6_9ACTN
MAYRKQKITEAAEHRQQAAELRADEAHRREATKLFTALFRRCSVGEPKPVIGDAKRPQA